MGPTPQIILHSHFQTKLRTKCNKSLPIPPQSILPLITTIFFSHKSFYINLQTMTWICQGLNGFKLNGKYSKIMHSLISPPPSFLQNLLPIMRDTHLIITTSPSISPFPPSPPLYPQHSVFSLLLHPVSPDLD